MLVTAVIILLAIGVLCILYYDVILDLITDTRKGEGVLMGSEWVEIEIHEIVDETDTALLLKPKADDDYTVWLEKRYLGAFTEIEKKGDSGTLETLRQVAKELNLI